MSFPRSYLWWKKTQRILRVPAGGPSTDPTTAHALDLVTQAGNQITTQAGDPLTREV